MDERWQAIFDQLSYLYGETVTREGFLWCWTDYTVRLLEAERDRALNVARGCLCGEGDE